MSIKIFYDKINDTNKSIDMDKLNFDIECLQDSLLSIKRNLKKELNNPEPNIDLLRTYAGHLEAEAMSINKHFDI